MPRIIYALISNGGITGGQKMMLRHVEALRDLGFDAVCCLGVGSKAPEWFAHDAPMLTTVEVQPDDVVVLPEDAPEALQANLGSGHRTVIISQNPYYLAASSLEVLDRFPSDRFPPVIAAGPKLAATFRRLYPAARVELVPCFADERIFRPGADKAFAVAYTPRKRPPEAKIIQGMFRKLHPQHADLAWQGLQNAPEARVAETFGRAGLFLSLNRLESVGLTPLEAMASGCVCAGFTGVGGWEYATADNGFWVPDDDCEAAADALAEAAAVFKDGGARLQRLREAGFETARAWSYARFREALDAVWTSLAPQARTRRT